MGPEIVLLESLGPLRKASERQLAREDKNRQQRREPAIGEAQ
jgi:hypothetical protein